MDMSHKKLPGARAIDKGRRHWVVNGAVALACLAGASSHAAAEDNLPRRNLLIEWRISGQTQGQQRNLGVQTGQVILDSNGRVIGRSSIGMGTIQTDDQSDDVQEVQVLNGGKARLYIGHTQPYSVWQWAWTGANAAPNNGGLGAIGPQAGASSGGQQLNVPVPQVIQQTVLIDIGQGLNVRPRWPGGRAPVIVELEAQSRQPMQAGSTYSSQTDPDGQSRRFEVGSSLSVPMGQWTVVARSGNQVKRQQSGTLSTRELDVNRSEQLEIRITAP
jgi:hypothetical protein